MDVARALLRRFRSQIYRWHFLDFLLVYLARHWRHLPLLNLVTPHYILHLPYRINLPMSSHQDVSQLCVHLNFMSDNLTVQQVR